MGRTSLSHPNRHKPRLPYFIQKWHFVRSYISKQEPTQLLCHTSHPNTPAHAQIYFRMHSIQITLCFSIVGFTGQPPGLEAESHASTAHRHRSLVREAWYASSALASPQRVLFMKFNVTLLAQLQPELCPHICLAN